MMVSVQILMIARITNARTMQSASMTLNLTGAFATKITAETYANVNLVFILTFSKKQHKFS